MREPTIIDPEDKMEIRCPECGEVKDVVHFNDLGELTDDERERGWVYDDEPCKDCMP